MLPSRSELFVHVREALTILIIKYYFALLNDYSYVLRIQSYQNRHIAKGTQTESLATDDKLTRRILAVEKGTRPLLLYGFYPTKGR